MCAMLLAEPASVDGGEITDKGYINQRAVLTRRANAVATLQDDASAEWIGCPGLRARRLPNEMMRPALRSDERSGFRDQSGLIRHDLGRVGDAPCHRYELARHHNDCHGVLLRA